MSMGSSIIVHGEPVHCGSRVRILIGTAGEFVARPKRTETRAVVWHWTGGLGDADRVLETLRRRRLSINFVIDRDGTIHQCCDANRSTSHAFDELRKISANPWSVGVEVCGRGGPGVWWTPEQETAGKALAASLSVAFGLPLECPDEYRELTRDELRGVRGHIGHHHVERVKSDPGAGWLKAVVTT